MPQTRSKCDLEDLGQMLEDAIRKEGLTMADAADLIGCTRRHLRRVRQGDHPVTAAEYLRRLGYEVELFAEVTGP